MTLARRVALSFCLFSASASAAFAEDSKPLSAIDWLSESVSAPDPILIEPEIPIADSASSPTITVTALDDPSPDRIGLLPSDVTGLPINLWSGSSSNALTRAILDLPQFDIPALRDFVTILMVAEAAPPLDAGPEGRMFLARVDALLAMGRLEEALALLEAAKPETPALFRRYFDIALLTGDEDRACDIMENRPAVAPTVPARIFCLARSGDWNAAALTLNTNRVLGDVDEDEVTLLTFFLDPELAEETIAPPVPIRVSPLIFRLREAIGESISTQTLPIAFAHADLRPTIGWKAQIDAGERLARNGGLPPVVLQELYGARRPSASGGVWDRVDAYQRFELAINAKDPVALSQNLPVAWEAMKDIRSEVMFADLYAGDLKGVSLTGPAMEISEYIGYLSADYETTSSEVIDPFLEALARGRPQEALTTDPTALAVQAAFNGAPPASDLSDLAANGQLGLSLLKAMPLLDTGIRGDQRALTESLSFLRSVGLEDLSRRLSLQLLILERQR